MKIPEKILQSNILPLSMLVTSRQEAVLFEAKDGELNELAAFKVERPENTDREGQFKTRGRGLVVRTGTVFERNDNALIRDFAREMNSLAKKYLAGQGMLYVFAPSPVKSRVIRSIKHYGKMTPEIFEGNYIHNHPLDLLEKIALLKGEQPHVPATNEEKRILQTGNVNFLSTRNSSSHH